MKSGNQLNHNIEELQLKLETSKQLIGETDTFLELSSDLFANEILLPYSDFLTIVERHDKLSEELATPSASFDFERIKTEINQLNEKTFTLLNAIQSQKKDKIAAIYEQSKQQTQHFKKAIQDITELKKEDQEIYKLKTIVHDLKIELLTTALQKNNDEIDNLLNAEVAHQAADNKTVISQFMHLFNLVNYQKNSQSVTAKANAEVITTVHADVRFYAANQLRVNLKKFQNQMNIMNNYIAKESALLNAYKTLFNSNQNKALNEKLTALSTQRKDLAQFLKDVPNDPENMDIHFKAIYRQVIELQQGCDKYAKQFEAFETERRQTSPISIAVKNAIAILEDEIARNQQKGYEDRVALLTPLHNSFVNNLSNYQSFKGNEYKITYSTSVANTDKKLKEDILAIKNATLNLKNVKTVCADHHGSSQGWLLSLLFKLHSALKSIFAPKSYAPTLFATKGGTEIIKIANLVTNARLAG